MPHTNNFESIIKRIGDDIAEASNYLKDRHDGLQIHDVTVELQGFASTSEGDEENDATGSGDDNLNQVQELLSLGPPQPAEFGATAKAAGSEAGQPQPISKLIISTSAAAPARPVTTGTTPISVEGYTEALARRKLEAQGFEVTVYYQVVESAKEGEPSQIGRVVRQLPVVGEALAPGQMVTLFIGLEARLLESEK